MSPLNVEFLNNAALSNRVIVRVLTRVLLVCSQNLPEVWVKNISVGKIDLSILRFGVEGDPRGLLVCVQNGQ